MSRRRPLAGLAAAVLATAGVTLPARSARADALLDEVTAVFMERGCPGCHSSTTARESLAEFTTSGGPRELLKSLAYRHYAQRERVLQAFGTTAFLEFPYLATPGIDPKAGTLETFLTNLTRDGDAVTDRDRDVLGRWFAAGAPLPADVQDEVFAEISAVERVIGTRR